MASVFTHAVVGLALAAPFVRPATPRRLLLLGAASAALPDLDVIGFWLSVPYDAMLGHRGLSHSFAAAAVWAVAVTWLAFRGPEFRRVRPRYALYIFFATASHALLDAMTSGGLGVALWAPFSGERIFFPFRPIEVSPLSVRSFFFTGRGLRVMLSEFLWVWLPAALFAAAVLRARRARSLSTPAGDEERLA
jgi:inner membrane protein